MNIKRYLPIRSLSLSPSLRVSGLFLTKIRWRILYECIRDWSFSCCIRILLCAASAFAAAVIITYICKSINIWPVRHKTLLCMFVFVCDQKNHIPLKRVRHTKDLTQIVVAVVVFVVSNIWICFIWSLTIYKYDMICASNTISNN